MIQRETHTYDRMRQKQRDYLMTGNMSKTRGKINERRTDTF